MPIEYSEILLEVVDRKASDLHLTAGSAPMLRQRGRLVRELAAREHAGPFGAPVTVSRPSLDQCFVSLQMTELSGDLLAGVDSCSEDEARLTRSRQVVTLGQGRLCPNQERWQLSLLDASPCGPCASIHSGCLLEDPFN